MKKIILQRLTLRDFQGGNYNLEADGQDVSAFGDNGTGKTRLSSAFSWLLFGKDSLGRKEFDIKNLDDAGEAAHGLEHTVEGVLGISGGVETGLKKIYKEIWKKTRGRAEKEFSGHTIDHFIDDVPKSKGEYDATIAEIAGSEETFRLLTSPTVFPALPWQKQRSLLLEVCGDITDADVIDSNPELKDLPAILGKKSLDDHRAVVTAEKKKINGVLETLPVRIDEQRRMMPDISGLHIDDVDKQIIAAGNSLNDAKLRLAGTETSGRYAALSKDLTDITAKIQKMENAHYLETMKQADRLNQELTSFQTFQQANGRREADCIAEIGRWERMSALLDNELDALRLKWSEVDAQEFQDTTQDLCAACGQSLPVDRVQAAREKALAIFNNNKAEMLGGIERKGRETKESRDKYIQAIDRLKEEIESIQAGDSSTTSKINELSTEIVLLKKKAESYTDIDGHTDLVLKMADINEAIAREKAGHKDDSGKIKEEIATLQVQLSAAKEKADRFVRREAGEKRIKDLMAQEKTLAGELERIERELYLCDVFIKTKVSLLTSKINEKFEVVRFKLFHENINGGIEPCCEITVGGVPFNSGLNNAARINAGLDVIRTLQKHYGVFPPVIIDNRESVTRIVDMPCQVISLIVSEADKDLRVEVGDRVAA
jgi:hypothetical protein